MIATGTETYTSTAAEWRPPVEVQATGYTVRVEFDAWGNPTARIVAPAPLVIIAPEFDPVDLIAEDLAAKVRRHDAWWDSRRAQLDRSDQLRRLEAPRGASAAAPTVGVLDGRLRRHAARVRCSR